ncbi:PepSY domain-containing protein [Candidatus Pacearchaeota archaeon]|nr:PepSY domain-containing protein [Candidatus Pacearchaeota archaeon]
MVKKRLLTLSIVLALILVLILAVHAAGYSTNTNSPNDTDPAKTIGKTGNNSNNATCGNNICETGEADVAGGCGPNADPSCLGPPAYIGTCPRDCKNKGIPTAGIQSGKKELKFENKTGETCLEGCTCQGVVMRCEVDGGREMTVFSSSGNTIVQVKEINMTTNVTLYKVNKTIQAKFNDGEKPIILPDEVEDKLKEKVKAKTENLDIKLNEEGFYEVEGKKKSRLFFIIPTKENVNAEIDAENGQIVKLRYSWWGFLAKDQES